MKLNRRWFPQIVEKDSGNLYPIYPPFPCSDFLLCGGVKMLTPVVGRSRATELPCLI